MNLGRDNLAVDIDALRENGIARVPLGLGLSQAQEIRHALMKCWCYPGHVKVYGDRVARTFDATRSAFDVWCHDMGDVVQLPHFWDLVASVAPVVGQYLEAPPRLYSVNAFWTRPSDREPQPDIQKYHRDADDDRFLAMFVYGTDVWGDYDGPHVFATRSHRDTIGPETRILGPAGTVFLADTRGLHYGEKPQRGDRLILWARWGVSERPVAYDIDKLRPVSRAALGGRYPQDRETQELVKLVVQ